MPLIVILYIALCLIQAGAFMASLQFWLGLGLLWNLPAFFAVLLLPLGGIAISAVAFYGAWQVWEWPWWQALILTLPGLVLTVLTVPAGGLVWMLLPRRRPRRNLRREAPTAGRAARSAPSVAPAASQPARSLGADPARVPKASVFRVPRGTERALTDAVASAIGAPPARAARNEPAEEPLYYVSGEAGHVLGPMTFDEVYRFVVDHRSPRQVVARRDGDPRWASALEMLRLGPDAEAGPGATEPSDGERAVEAALGAIGEGYRVPPSQDPEEVISTRTRWVAPLVGAVIGLPVGIWRLLAGDPPPVDVADPMLRNAYLAGFVTAWVLAGAAAGGVFAVWRYWVRRREVRIRAGLVPAERDYRFDNLIARFWRGESSLGLTYWFGGFLASVAAQLVVRAGTTFLDTQIDYAPAPIFYTLLAMWLAVSAITVWQVVSVWRAANRHIERRIVAGRKAGFWAGAAKLIVFLTAVASAFVLATAGIPQMTATAKIAFLGDPDLPDYAVRVVGDDQVQVDGGFKYGLSDTLAVVLRAAPDARVVQLDSPGGRIGEAEKVFRLIRERGLGTYVADYCLSACTLAFLGGAQRMIAPGALLGFHAPSFPGIDPRQIGPNVETALEVMLSAGVEKDFALRGLTTPSDEMWFPDAVELKRAKVVTGVVPADRYRSLPVSDPDIGAFRQERDEFQGACVRSCGSGGASCAVYCGCVFQGTRNLPPGAADTSATQSKAFTDMVGACLTDAGLAPARSP